MKFKKSLLKSALLAASLFMMNPTHAWEPVGNYIRIPLSLTEVHPDIGYPRTPVDPPQVGQTGYTLFFLDETDLFLNIYSVDEGGDETLEYSTAVPSTTTEVQLPSTLSGTYIIEVVRDNMYFRGETEL